MQHPLCDLQAEQWHSQQASKHDSAVAHGVHRKLFHQLVSLTTRDSSSRCKGNSANMQGAVQCKPVAEIPSEGAPVIVALPALRIGAAFVRLRPSGLAAQACACKHPACDTTPRHLAQAQACKQPGSITRISPHMAP